MIKEIVEHNCQFIIATHSPILMSLPDADIYSIEEDQLLNVQYDEIEQVKLTKDFLNSPERFIKHL